MLDNDDDVISYDNEDWETKNLSITALWALFQENGDLFNVFICFNNFYCSLLFIFALKDIPDTYAWTIGLAFM